MAPIAGRVILHKIRKEDKFLKAGGTYEPPTFYEMNQQMIPLKQETEINAKLVKWISPPISCSTINAL